MTVPTAIAYAVHSAVEEGFDVEVEYRGQKIRGRVPGFVVELVCDDGLHGHTFRIPSLGPDHMAEMRRMFKPGARVGVAFTALPPKK